MKRLAQNIDALAEKDRGFLSMARQMEQVRRAAASELYAICRDFVNSLNRLMAKGELMLDPEQFSDATYREDAINLVQIAVDRKSVV